MMTKCSKRATNSFRAASAIVATFTSSGISTTTLLSARHWGHEYGRSLRAPGEGSPPLGICFRMVAETLGYWYYFAGKPSAGFGVGVRPWFWYWMGATGAMASSVDS